MSISVRFAPSPTGPVHIGNIRVAIFNWLFERHQRGRFLLRVEDTDRERCTDQAIATMFESMEWLGLDCDEPPLYQTSRSNVHLEQAEKLLQKGLAYKSDKDGQGEVIVFRIPLDADRLPFVKSAETIEIEAHRDVPVTVDATGVQYAWRV